MLNRFQLLGWRADWRSGLGLLSLHVVGLTAHVAIVYVVFGVDVGPIGLHGLATVLLVIDRELLEVIVKLLYSR